MLLDLGVIRPYKFSDITDDSGERPFMATLRYSSPEYLVRAEADDADGWRRLTFYQLGAVLHDMIMRRPLFEASSETFGQLVVAVMQTVPDIVAPDVPPDLVVLARQALVKDPVERSNLVNWATFLAASEDHLDPVLAIRARIAARQSQAGEAHLTERAIEQEQRSAIVLLSRSAEELMRAIRKAGLDDPLFPRIILSQDDDASPDERTISIEIPAASAHALLVPVQAWLKVELHDRPESIGRILASAAIGPLEAPPTHLDLIYAGVLDPAAVAERARTLIYTVLDEALRLCAEPDIPEPGTVISCAPEATHG